MPGSGKVPQKFEQDVAKVPHSVFNVSLYEKTLEIIFTEITCYRIPACIFLNMESRWWSSALDKVRNNLPSLEETAYESFTQNSIVSSSCVEKLLNFLPFFDDIVLK
jgi:hypothetical protein